MSPAWTRLPIMAGAEAGAFLVGPVDQFEGGLGGDAGFGKDADGFEGGENAGDAIEAAAGGDGVEVAAEGDGRDGFAAGAAVEGVAQRVAFFGEAELAAPGGEEGAGFGVERAEGRAVAAAFGRGADFGHAHMVGPEAGGVDGEGWHGGRLVRAACAWKGSFGRACRLRAFRVT